MDFRLYGANPGVIAFAVHQVAVQAYVNDLWKGECGNICHIAADAGNDKLPACRGGIVDCIGAVITELAETVDHDIIV